MPRPKTTSSLRAIAGLLTAAVMVAAASAVAAEQVPGGSFTDDDGSVHEGAIEAVAAEGITLGCNPPGNYRFCPHDPITRGQMAAFLVRALDLGAGGADQFGDVGDSPFAADIGALAASGVTKGCNPPVNDRFCPDDAVARGQMAAFLVRAFGLPPSPEGAFNDDDGSVFEDDIDALAASGVTRGCSTSGFCPEDPVTRAEMASFLARALGLSVTTPLPATTAHVVSITDGDTIRVLVDGVNEPLRLIGIDTAETGEPCAAEATETLEALVERGTVRLQIDVSDRDRFGRLLRYVFDAEGVMVNEEMVRRGWAEAVEFPPDTAYASVLEVAEAAARSAGLGLWSGDCSAPGDGGTTTTTSPPPPDGGCDPSYPTVCIPPPPPDLNCDDVPYDDFAVLEPDPHGFDGNNDGVGCQT
ncbi:MAG: thermonuclease family protein [Acidimicrobiia bacterium]